MIGWTPASCAVTENSSAANMLLVSVTATAGIACAAAEVDQLLHRHRAFQKRVFGMDAEVDESGRV